MHQPVKVCPVVLGPCSPLEVSLHFHCALPSISRWFRNKLLREGLLKTGNGHNWEKRDHSYFTIFFWWLVRPQER